MMNQLWVSDPLGSKIHYWTQNGNAYNYGGSVTVGSGAGTMTFSQDGKTSYVANQDDNSVSVVNVAELKEMMRIPIEKIALASSVTSADWDVKTKVLTV